MSKFIKMPPLRISSFCFAAIALVCLIISTPSFGEPATRQPAKPKTGTTHVYLLRGLLNIFSTGMDGIRDKLKKRHIEASVDNHSLWRFLADGAVEDYKRGRVRTIVIMGHSAGAINAVDMANRIGEAGVPVSLVVTFDPAFRTTVTSNNVKWVVNLYMPHGIGAKVYKGDGYKGRVENVDLGNKPVHHMTLDKIGFVQDQAISYALKVAKTGGQPPASNQPATAKMPAASARAKTGNPAEQPPPQQ